MSRWAVLVEDDPEQAEYACFALEEVGFVVSSFSTAASARAACLTGAGVPELVVLDRRLPLEVEDEADDEVGDGLLDEWLTLYRSTPFIVLTGFSGIEHMQFVTTERGQIIVGGTRTTIDRVRPFTKDQTTQFEEYLRVVVSVYDELDAIELTWHGSAAPASNRLLRRVCQDVGGVSVTARTLTGGLTGAPVLWCVVSDSVGRPIAYRVVKAVTREATVAGGLQALLPANLVAAHVGLLDVPASVDRANVMQIAGVEPVSLLDALVDDEDLSLKILSELIRWPWPTSVLQTVTIEELIRPILSWEKLETLLKGSGLRVPNPKLRASAGFAAQHGDLHPGNVLVSSGVGVLIDFDCECVASALLDPLTLLLSPWFHRDSPMRSMAVRSAPGGVLPLWLEKVGDSSWLRLCWGWVEERKTSPRELYALMLAYAARQLKYPDVVEDPAVKARAVLLAATALDLLDST